MTGLRVAGHLGVRGPDAPLLPALAGSSAPSDQIALLARLGFAGVADNYLSLRPAAEQAAIGADVARHGLAMGSFVHDPARWDQPTWQARDPDGQAALRAVLEASLAAAARSGSRTIVCVTGRQRGVPDDIQRVAFADNPRRAGDRAGRNGVTLCIEATHPAFAPGLLVERVADAIALVSAVAHPHVALDLDIGHVALHGDDPLDAIAAAGRIGVVQAADVPGRVEPGAGTLDWPPLLAALVARGYAGLVELELEPALPGGAGERAMLARLAALGLLPDAP